MKAKTEDGYEINIPDSFKGYKFKELIGSGSTSVVCLVEDEYNCELFSAKIIPKKYIQSKNLLNQINTEISVLKKVEHKNIVKYRESFEFTAENNEIYIILILEYCENNDLYNFIAYKNFEDDNQKKKIFRGILNAIQYLHKLGIAHGDIKPENILLDSNYNPKLSDFGFCKTKITGGDESKSGTLYYAAPELFVRGQFNTLKADIWSIGILLYCVSEKNFPFIKGNQNFTIKQIVSGQLNLKEDIDEKLRNVVIKCTQLCADNRPCIDRKSVV